MRVLFIGATGRLGRDVVPILREKHDMTLAALGGGEVDGQPVLDMDIAEFQSVMDVVAGGAEGGPFDAVVNCAIADYRNRDLSETAARIAYESECLRINAGGAYHVYEASAQSGVGKVVFISSMTAFIGPPEPAIFDKNTPDQPLDIYACSKIFGEHAGRYYAYRHEVFGPNLQVICLRLGSLHVSSSGWSSYMRSSERRRAITSDWRDIAQGIDCALNADIRYGVYTLVSAADTGLINPELYEELGYKPAWRATPEGMVPANAAIETT